MVWLDTAAKLEQFNQQRVSDDTCHCHCAITSSTYVIIAGGYVDVAAKLKLVKRPSAFDGSCNNHLPVNLSGDVVVPILT